MGIETTLSIIKPDAVRNGNVGDIIARLEGSGLRVSALKMARLTQAEAKGFYHVHQERPFFSSLVEFMTSGPVVLILLEGEDAITRYRGLMGATNPADADAGTLRADFATNIEQNAVHGSDAPETAAFETSYFFNTFERPYQV